MIKKLLAVLLSAVVALTVFRTEAQAAAPKLGISLTYGSGATYAELSGSGTIYYTTDGTKPTSKSKKYTGRIKITKPCKLRAASYVNGSRVKAVFKTVKVKLKAPTVKLTEQGGAYAEYSVSAPAGAEIYYTSDGSKPGRTNGKRVYAGSVSVRENCTLKFVCVKEGWKNSSVKSVKVSGILTPDQYAEEVVRLVNLRREENGLAPLEMTDGLMQTAKLRADELTEYYSHSRPDGSDCFTALKNAGISYRGAGENIAAGYDTPESVVEGWMNSPGHRANILKEKFTQIGVGYAYDEDTAYGSYWTQIFIG